MKLRDNINQYKKGFGTGWNIYLRHNLASGYCWKLGKWYYDLRFGRKFGSHKCNREWSVV